MNQKTFWTGPFGIRAATEVYQVPARDGVNWVDADGIETEMRTSGMQLDEVEYLAKYGTRDNEGNYWYIPQSVNICGGIGAHPTK